MPVDSHEHNPNNPLYCAASYLLRKLTATTLISLTKELAAQWIAICLATTQPTKNFYFLDTVSFYRLRLAIGFRQFGLSNRRPYIHRNKIQDVRTRNQTSPN